MKKTLLLFCFWLCMLNTVKSQFVDFRSFFRPGLRLTADWIPSSELSDSMSFGMTHYRVASVFPLKTKVGINTSKLDLKNLSLKDVSLQASQRFLTVNVGYRNLEASRIGQDRSVWNATIGLTGIKATTKSGFWLWSANVGMVESFETDQLNPFLIAGVVHANIKGIHKQNFLGLAITANRASILPLPIIGWRRKLASKTHINIFLPVHLSIDRNLGKGSSLMWSNNFIAVNPMMSPDAGFDRFGGNAYEQLRISYGGLRSGVQYRLKLTKEFKLQVSGGVTLWDGIQLSDTNRNQLAQYNRGFHPYANATIFYRFGKKGIGSEIFGNEI